MVRTKKYNFTKSFVYEGKRYYIRGDTEREVYEKMALKKRDLENNVITYDSTTTVAEWAEMALSTYKSDVSERWQYDIHARMDKHILAEIGRYQLRKIKPAQLQKLLNKKEDYSKEYIDKIYQLLYFIFETAVNNDLIPKNPATALTRPKGRGKQKRRTITDTERKHLLAVADQDQAYLPFLFMLFCGCRPGEALEIQGRDIIRKHGKTILHIRGTKTDNSDRMVPLPEYLADRLPDRGPFEYIALSRHGRPHTGSSYKALTRSLYRAMNISMGCRVYRNELMPPYPLADDFVPYCLRHTYCTDLQKAGVDIRTAQHLMGHADITTTANIYTHSSEKALLEAAEKIEQLSSV